MGDEGNSSVSHESSLQDETERLRKRVEALKRMQKLKQEAQALKRQERELKGWLREHEDRPRPSSPTYDEYSDDGYSDDGRGKYSDEESYYAEEDFDDHSPSSISASPPSQRLRRKSASAGGFFRSRTSSRVAPQRYDVETQDKNRWQKLRRRRGGSPFGFGNLKRKVSAVIFDDLDDETILGDNAMFFIMILKEATIGFIIALAMISLLATSDSFYFRLRTAPGFGRLMNAVGMHTPMAGGTAERTKMSKKSSLNDGTKDLYIVQRETAQDHGKTDKVIPRLDLERFCDDCLWSAKDSITCSQRVQTLLSNHRISKHKAVMAAMQEGSCVRSTESHTEPRKQELNDVFADYEVQESVATSELVKHWYVAAYVLLADFVCIRPSQLFFQLGTCITTTFAQNASGTLA